MGGKRTHVLEASLLPPRHMNGKLDQKQRMRDVNQCSDTGGFGLACQAAVPAREILQFVFCGFCEHMYGFVSRTVKTLHRTPAVSVVSLVDRHTVQHPWAFGTRSSTPGPLADRCPRKAWREEERRDAPLSSLPGQHFQCEWLARKS